MMMTMTRQVHNERAQVGSITEWRLLSGLYSLARGGVVVIVIIIVIGIVIVTVIIMIIMMIMRMKMIVTLVYLHRVGWHHGDHRVDGDHNWKIKHTFEEHDYSGEDNYDVPDDDDLHHFSFHHRHHCVFSHRVGLFNTTRAATLARHSRRPLMTATDLKLLASTSKYLQLPPSTWQYLWVLTSTSEYLPVPTSICLHHSVLVNTSEYLSVPPRLGTDKY